jgi:hypothetical protein
MEHITEMLKTGTKEEILDKLLVNRDNIFQVASSTLLVKCTQDIEKSFDALGVQIAALTKATTKAGRSSSYVGGGLILTGLGAWAYFFLELYKLWHFR